MCALQLGVNLRWEFLLRYMYVKLRLMRVYSILLFPDAQAGYLDQLHNTFIISNNCRLLSTRCQSIMQCNHCAGQTRWAKDVFFS
jgi:hypothetical protein